MSWHIRKVERGDLPLLVALGQGDVDAWGHAQFAAEYEVAISKIFVAEGAAPETRGGPPVLLGCLVRWAVGDETQILNVVVHPAARRRGVGRRLMQAALDEAILCGHRQVVLEVRQDNAQAITLYTQLGFAAAGTRPSYYVASGGDAVLMTLRLTDP